MKSNTSVKVLSTVSVQVGYTTGSVISKDGVSIGYRKLGQGPAVVVLHGAAESAQGHMELAEAQADTFTIYLPDRRGRGLSGPYGKDYQVQEDVDDMDALLTKTGAHFVFGVSSGADIWLQAALPQAAPTLPAIEKIALYEPALFINSPAPIGLLRRYENEMAQGRVAAALVTAMKATQMGPAIFNLVPRWLLERLTTTAIKSEDKKARDTDVTMRKLAPTLHYDFELVAAMSAQNPENFKAIRHNVLLLGGSQSPAFLKGALDALEKVLPRARRIEFPGLNHGGSGNKDRGGQPEQVAQELRQFFS